MEWGANPQRAGHCNVEPLPGESSHWRKLRRRERAKKRSQDTFCVESPQGGICFAISAQNYGFARFFIYRPASIQFSKRAQAKNVRAFIRQGRGAIPSRILSKKQQHEIIRQHAQCQLAADSFFSFFCKEKALINVYIRAFSFVLFRIFASCRILMPQRSTCLLWTGAFAYLKTKRAFCIALGQASCQASTISPT